MWARTDASIEGRQKLEVQLMLQPGMSVSGHIAFDGNGQPPTEFTGARIVLASSTQGSVLSGSAMGNIDADGKFVHQPRIERLRDKFRRRKGLA